MGYWEQRTALMSGTVFFRILIFSILIISCNESDSLPYYNSPDFNPLFLTQKEAEKKIDHKIDSFVFENQNGQEIGLKDLIGKIHVANFMFTQCAGICPIMTNNFKYLEERYEKNDNLVMLSFSVTPWIDSVPRLKSYTQDYEVKKKSWHFLTGKTAEIYALARTSYFAEENLGFTKDSTDFLHTEHVLLIDQSLRIRGIYNGTLPLEIKQLSNDIQILMNKKSGKQFGL